MEEEKPKEEAPKEEPSEAQSMVEKVTSLYDKIKSENDRTEKLLKKQEEIKTLEALSGKSEGKGQEEPKKKLTPKEYKDAIMRGEVPKE